MGRNERTTSHTIRGLLVVAATAMAAMAAPAPGGSLPTVATGLDRAPRTTATVTPTVLATMAMAAADGVAVGPDGTVYGSESGRDRVMAQAPDGTVTIPLEGIDGPTAIDVGSDGRIVVATKTAIVVTAADGTRSELPIPHDASVDAVAFDSAGTIYLTDWDASGVWRFGSDGTWTEVDFGTTGRFRGLAVGPDDSLYVIDLDANDVVRRTPDGTVTPIGFTSLVDPRAVDVQGDRIAVAQSGSVVIREGDGTEGSPTDFGAGDPTGVRLEADGTLYLAYRNTGTGRSPEVAGGILSRSPAGQVERLGFGDLYAFGSVASSGAGTVLYTSWSGIPGYSDPNPVRRVVGEGPSEDVYPGSSIGTVIAAADDGTVYRTAGQGRVERIAYDGSTTDVPLPTEPGLDAVTGLSVDDAGRLFVAMGSGYGSGPFQILEPLAPGGSKTWYRSAETTDALLAMAAGGGTLQVVVASGDDQQLRTIGADGSSTVRADLPGALVATMEVDAGGTAYLVTYPERSGVITVVAPDGSSSTLSYGELMYPRSLSMGPDRTLYVGDDQLGLLALAGIGTAAAPGGTATPATPVPGRASYTG